MLDIWFESLSAKWALGAITNGKIGKFSSRRELKLEVLAKVRRFAWKTRTNKITCFDAASNWENVYIGILLYHSPH